VLVIARNTVLGMEKHTRAKRRVGIQRESTSEQKNHRIDDSNRGIPRKKGGTDVLVTLTGSRALHASDLWKPNGAPLPARTKGKVAAKPSEMRTKTRLGHVAIISVSCRRGTDNAFASSKQNRSWWCFE